MEIGKKVQESGVVSKGKSHQSWYGVVDGGKCWTCNISGYTYFIELKSQRMKEWVPPCAMILYDPKFFLESFLEGPVEQKYFALMKPWSPTLKSIAGVHLAFTDPWYHAWVAAISSQRN